MHNKKNGFLFNMMLTVVFLYLKEELQKLEEVYYYY